MSQLRTRGTKAVAGSNGWQRAVDGSLERLIGLLTERIIENVPRASG